LTPAAALLPHAIQRLAAIPVGYLGLVPATGRSGNRDPQRRISEEDDVMPRRLLVGGAHYILGPFGSDSDLRRHGQKIASRGAKNSKKRAVVAVARKLAVLLHRLWVSGELYDPLYNAHRRRERWEAAYTQRRWRRDKRRGGEDTTTRRRGAPKWRMAMAVARDSASDL
jgi:hypothetical protein